MDRIELKFVVEYGKSINCQFQGGTDPRIQRWGGKVQSGKFDNKIVLVNNEKFYRPKNGHSKNKNKYKITL